MNIEQFLNSETESIAADLSAAPEGLYLDEEYEGRKVQLKRTLTGYAITITNPGMALFTTGAEDAIRRIKDELLK